MYQGLRKYLLYLMFLLYFGVSIAEIIIIGKEEVRNRKDELDKIYKVHYMNVSSEYKEFDNVCGTYKLLSVISLIIIIVIMICWNVIMITFVCCSFQEGAKCTALCCKCFMTDKDFPNCLNSAINCATGYPILGQMIIAILGLISKSAEIVYLKKTRKKVFFQDIIIYYINEYIKKQGVMIALLCIIIVLSIIYKILDRYLLNKSLEKTINTNPNINIPYNNQGNVGIY